MNTSIQPSHREICFPRYCTWCPACVCVHTCARALCWRCLHVRSYVSPMLWHSTKAHVCVTLGIFTPMYEPVWVAAVCACEARELLVICVCVMWALCTWLRAYIGRVGQVDNANKSDERFEFWERWARRGGGGGRASLLCVLTYSARSLAHVRRMHGGRYARNICLRQLISNVRTCARSHAIKSAIPPYQRTIHTVCTYVYHMLVRVCARHPWCHPTLRMCLQYTCIYS